MPLQPFATMERQHWGDPNVRDPQYQGADADLTPEQRMYLYMLQVQQSDPRYGSRMPMLEGSYPWTDYSRQQQRL